MQTAPMPSGGPNETTGPVSRRAEMPRDILTGIILACFGVGFTGIIFGWGYFAMRGVGTPGGFVVVFQTVDALEAAQALVLNLGLFLLFLGILRRLPRGGVWSLLGPVLVLVGGIALAIAASAQSLLVPFLFSPPFPSPGPEANVALLQTVGNAALFVGGAAASLGLLISLIAVARGVLARRAPSGPLAPM